MSEAASGRKRTISNAMDLDPQEASGSDESGLRRRRLQPPEPTSDENAMSKEQSKPSAKQPSVVPLSMQLLRPFWAMGCCPDCRPDSSMVPTPLMLDSRLRSVSTASLSGLDTSRSSSSRLSSETPHMLSGQKTSASSISSESAPDTTQHQELQSSMITSYECITTIEQIIQEYTSACTIYGCPSRLNPGVLTCIRYSLPTLRVSGSFFDADMLALVEILIKHCNGALKFVKRLDFSVAGVEGRSVHGSSGGANNKMGFKSHGAYALSRVLAISRYIEEVYLPNNRIGPYGASALFEVLRENDTVKTLGMKGCRIGERGALAFKEKILGDGSRSALVDVDLSINRIGFRGCYEIEQAMKDYCESAVVQSMPMHVNLDANMVLQEVLNSVTHGLGVILAIIATILLTKRVQGLPSYYTVSCAIYSTALIVLYMTSTLYHSFFALRTIHSIFKVIDRCAIYILIAGSYSPFLVIALHHNEVWSWHLLLFIWACALGGMLVEATMFRWAHKAKFSLGMYIGMGWCCLVCLPDLMAVLPKRASTLLVAGGLAYTAGIPFFVRKANLDHAIWHLFVLAGSIFHWLCVYLYVVAL